MSNNIDDWVNGIRAEFKLYSQEVNDEIAAIADKVAQESVDWLKATDNYGDHTGKYRKSFKKKTEKTPNGVNVSVYSTKPQLTHLLEHGHATNGGTGRTGTFPHWKIAEQAAISEFISRVEQVLSE